MKPRIRKHPRYPWLWICGLNVYNTAIGESPSDAYRKWAWYCGGDVE